jgi:hypothetical protein
MTPTRAATSTADRTHVRRRNWAGEPPLLLGENAHGYDELLAEVSRVLLPRAQARRSHCRCAALRGRMPVRRRADRSPRHPRGAVALLARALEDRAAIESLATLDSYESDARSLRKSAARKLAAARASRVPRVRRNNLERDLRQRERHCGSAAAAVTETPGVRPTGWERIAWGRFRYFPQTKPSSANEANE